MFGFFGRSGLFIVMFSSGGSKSGSSVGVDKMRLLNVYLFFDLKDFFGEIFKV